MELLWSKTAQQIAGHLRLQRDGPDGVGTTDVFEIDRHGSFDNRGYRLRNGTRCDRGCTVGGLARSSDSPDQDVAN